MNCLRLHLHLLKSILVVQFIVTIVEPSEHTLGNHLYENIGRLELLFGTIYFFTGSILIVPYIFSSSLLFKDKVFREGELFNKVSNTPKNYTIRYKYWKKEVGGGISYTRFNILGAQVDFHPLKQMKQFRIYIFQIPILIVEVKPIRHRLYECLFKYDDIC